MKPLDECAILRGWFFGFYPIEDERFVLVFPTLSIMLIAEMYRIIFVCHGNICRSPAAEFIMADLLRKQGLEDAVSVCSRATSFEEIGNDTYPPMKRALAEANVPIYPRQAARITQTDYDQSDAIYYMDQSNLSYLRRIVDDRRGILRPITELVPDLEEIEDPWYTGRYQRVVNQIRRCVEAILADLRKRLDL